MKEHVDLYDSHYGRLDDDVYRSIRAETFGVDLGQESWITAEEADRFADWLGIRTGQRVLEVACGSGGVAARIATRTGASVVGIDINALAVRAAQERAKAMAIAGGVEFRTADAEQSLPFPDGSFDVVICNDAINHLRDRLGVLREWRRVLRAGGQCLYTDPVVVTGLVSNAELEARSSIGFFLFSSPGVNEARLQETGFRVERTTDLTESVVATSSRWCEARAKRRAPLVALETEARFEGVQRFLGAVHALAAARKLSRFAFIGRRIEGDSSSAR
ncbi:MAG TPA: methyltransferase domain-containing protein [Planctomycetota bacterium]